MHLISFDVGIKHLAYCIIHFENDNVFIKEWNVINLCDETYLCQATINDVKEANNNKCNKNAIYCKFDTYYCKKHTKHLTYSIPPKEFNDKIIKKMKLEDLSTFCKTYNIEFHKPYTKNALLEKINNYKSEHFLEEIKSKNASQYDLIYLGIQIKEKLNQILQLQQNKYNIDIAVIENQISPIANRMKTIQGMLAQYLIMNNIHNIIFYSASNKLKIFTSDKDKTTYTQRKKMSIQYTQQLLEEYVPLQLWINYFNKHKKNDDLADCFLQGLSYLIQKYNCKIIEL